MDALLAGGPARRARRAPAAADPGRIARDGRRSRRPTCWRPSRGPARSSRSAATTGSTSTRRAPTRRRRRSSSRNGRARSSGRAPRSAGTRRSPRRSTTRRSSRSSSAATARRVSVADALDHVLGYTCLNDVSARDLQFGDGQWVRGKSLDTFCPMGPALVTADEIADPAGARDHVPRRRRGRPGGEHLRDVLRRRRDHQLLLAVVHARAGRRDRDRHARRRRRLPRPAAVLLGDGDVVTVEIERIGRLVNTLPLEPRRRGRRMSGGERSAFSSPAPSAASARGPSARSSARARRSSRSTSGADRRRLGRS